MAETVADFVLKRLRDWDVEHVFCYPGDGINGLVAALGRAGSPSVVQPRHEETGALEAVGYAKFGGGVGVCMATSGPGAIHLLNGLYDAKLDHVPVVAIVGQVARTAIGGSYMQEVDLQTLFKDVASDYVQTVTVPQQLPNVLDRAMRTALDRRAPTCVIIPADLQEVAYEPPAHAFRHVPSGAPGYAAPETRAPETEIARAAEVINAGRKVAILVGQGARGAAAEVMELADLTGGGVAKALLGKDVISDEPPFVTGAIGLLGTRPSYEMMRDCDTLVIIGSSFPYAQYLPEFGRARAVQIDVDAHMIGMRYPTEVNLIGDARATLRALLPRLRRKEHGDWRRTIERNVERWWETMEMQARVPADPVNPMLVFHELSSRLPDDAVVTCDSGTAANWYARQLRFRGRMRGSLSGTLATMGPAVPYAIGAKFAHPGRPAIALTGDGAMQMNGLAELITVRRYWRRWTDPRLIVAVLHNNDLNQVTWELRAMGGSPRVPATQDLPDVSYAAFARSLDLEGIDVDKPELLGSAWDQALGADRPVVLDVRCSPDMPPIPPHAEFDQMKNMLEALLKGDKDAWGIVNEGVRAKLQEARPRR
ncbi:MAG: thiamine pyrophosphate-requiring protein [Actinomadura rubrobrunea]|nr:thiamine pyrophosphate-requiring protein [Actinomadura rubrobrunea]